MATVTRVETPISSIAGDGSVDDARRDARAGARVTSQHAVLPFAPGARNDLEPLPIIAFAKDWHEDPTSNHHVLRELAKNRRVLWLNSLATRTPKLSSGRDLGKIQRKLREFAKGPVNVENDLWVFSPLVLPLPHHAWARAINQRVLRATIRGLRWQLGIERFQLWTFLPTSAEYVGTLGEDSSIYYCVDEWSMFSYLDRVRTAAAERELLGKVDAVFAINHALAESKRALNHATYVSPHGVDHAAFAAALGDAMQVPADIAAIPGPRIGFYGTLRDWVDLELVAHVAKAKPAWSIVLLGQVLCDASAIAGIPNVHLLGQKRHDELPAYCKAFDVGIIPYRIDERMSFVNPLKLREYLSAGLPVVSTPVPEVARYRDLCRIAPTRGEFVEAIEAALREGGKAAREERSAAMKNETWSARVADVMRVVDEISHAKQQRKGR
jgi:glycosyltransferase involved in cell wall biosynthesis